MLLTQPAPIALDTCDSDSDLKKLASPPNPAYSCIKRKYDPRDAMNGSSRVSRSSVCEIADLTDKPAALRILSEEKQISFVQNEVVRDELVLTTWKRLFQHRTCSVVLHRRRVHALPAQRTSEW